MVDYLNIMIYDGPDHGTMDQFNQNLAYWQERGLPREKTVLGVPFYSHPAKAPTAAGYVYAKLVADNPLTAQTDKYDYYSEIQIYNGTPAIKAKTKLARQKASGILFWTLEQDAIGDLYLLKALYETAHEGK